MTSNIKEKSNSFILNFVKIYIKESEQIFSALIKIYEKNYFIQNCNLVEVWRIALSYMTQNYIFHQYFINIVCIIYKWRCCLMYTP